MSKKSQIYCPKCKSVNFTVVDSSRSALSLGKGVAGAVVLGPIGAGAALLGKKGKVTFVCQNCGNTWKQKV